MCIDNPKALSSPATHSFSHLCLLFYHACSMGVDLPAELTAVHAARGWKVAKSLVSLPRSILRFSVPVPGLPGLLSMPGTAHLSSLQVPDFLSSSAGLAGVLQLTDCRLILFHLCSDLHEKHHVAVAYVLHGSVKAWVHKDFPFSLIIESVLIIRNLSNKTQLFKLLSVNINQRVKIPPSSKTDTISKKPHSHRNWRKPRGAGMCVCEVEWAQIKQPYPWPWQLANLS